MKTISSLFVFVLIASGCFGQSFFTQNATWIKNQLKQIALWQLYIRDAEKGYAIAKEGLATITSIKNGDFHLHLDHFNALSEVNPVIRKYMKAAEILEMQADIKELFPATNDVYINAVFNHLLAGCDSDIQQLDMLLSPGNYQMTDDERLASIDKIFADMKDKYAFAKSFSNDVKVLSLQQLKEKNEVKTSRLLNNTKLN